VGDILTLDHDSGEEDEVSGGVVRGVEKVRRYRIGTE
jgi:hypothetical protein